MLSTECRVRSITIHDLRFLLSRMFTLKAFANSSPGFALKPLGTKTHIHLFTTLKGLRSITPKQPPAQPFQGCIFLK